MKKLLCHLKKENNEKAQKQALAIAFDMAKKKR